jgi:hypothetical protein
MKTLVNSVVPSIGTYCLTTIHNKAIVQTFYDNIDVLEAAGLDASAQGKNAYYAMASFKDASTRTQGNVLRLKAFWLDVDCKDKDPLKDYADKSAGFTAIKQFCARHSFPRPTVIDSGNGWHVYWILENEITKEEWQPVADKLKSLCLNDDLRIDPACTADSARILRIPNTKNYRDGNTTDVKEVVEADPVMFDSLKGLIDLALSTIHIKPVVRIAGAPTKREMSAVTKALIGNTSSSFKKIMMRSCAGTGCKQLLHGVTEQATIDEPFWRAVLSVAQHCNDSTTSIHLVSNQHPDYDYDATVAKAAQTKGPYTCATFDSLRANECAKCPSFNKITSPIQLGNEVMAATAPVTVSIAPKPAPIAHMVIPIVAVTDASTDMEKVPPVDTAKIDAALVAFNIDKDKVTIPVPPKPYLRGVNGGLYRQTKADDGTFEDVMIYEDDLYVYARLWDPDEKQVLACRLHTPLDGVRVFNVPLKSVGSRDKLREIICGQGVAATDKTVSEISLYLIAMTKELGRMQREENARTQMGWQDDGTFILGEREYSKKGIRNCPPSNATLNYQAMFRMEGSMAEWRKVVDIYNAPGFDVHQFIFFMALSSPLLKAMNHPGMLTTLISDESGIGKTTLGMVCNSVWGHPREMLSMPHDTINATVNRMGVFNSLSLFLDEFTNKTPEVCSEVVYMSTMGRGKNRSTITGVERVNNTTWNLNSFATANAALRDKLGSLKASAEGENMRLFEFDMRGTPVIPKDIADAIFPLMQTNFGVAGHFLASWLVENIDEIKPMVERVQRKLDVKFKFTSKERNWSLGVACSYTVAFIAKELKIHDFPIQTNMDAMVKQIDRMRGEVEQSITHFDALISDFLVENHSSILVVDGLPDANGLMSPPRNRNINRIVARYEPDTGKLYIASKQLRDYCVTRQFSFNSLTSISGAKLGNKRIAAGSGVVAGNSRTVEFDTNMVNIDVGMWHDMEDQADVPAAA